MPLYVYKCPSCGHTFEALKPMAERETAICEKCGEKAERDFLPSCAFVHKSQGCSGDCGGCSGCCGGH